MKIISAYVFWLQISVFIIGTLSVAWLVVYGISQGGVYNNGLRALAFFAPYLVLPFCITLSFVLDKNGLYTAAAFSPFVLLIIVAVAGRLYLKIVPNPFADNFGPRPLPYQGFLALSAEDVPIGFKEFSHRYSKQEYSLEYINEHFDECYLRIFESTITKYGYSTLENINRFEYKGIAGNVYASYDESSGKSGLYLIWLNPPKQRVLISHSYRHRGGLSPDDLIKLLHAMKAIP